jgi:hypothetical protein
MAVQEEIEWSLDLKRDLAAYAAPPKCWHSRLFAWFDRGAILPESKMRHSVVFDRRQITIRSSVTSARPFLE